MRYLAILIACVACALPAGATVDPDVDQIGVYFDLNADETCLEVDPNGLFSVYMIVTNPSATEVQGIEASLCWSGTAMRIQLTWYENWIGIFDTLCQGFHVSFYEPVPFVGSNVPLVRIDYILTGESEVEFYLGPEGPQYDPDGLPEYMDASGNIYPLGVSSGDRSLPVAVVNGDCDVVSTTGKTFGDVKSLFR